MSLMMSSFLIGDAAPTRQSSFTKLFSCRLCEMGIVFVLLLCQWVFWLDINGWMMMADCRGRSFMIGGKNHNCLPLSTPFSYEEF